MNKKALIFWGGWSGHDPENIANLFAKKLVENSYLVDIYNNMDCLSDKDTLALYDLIISVWTMGDIKNDYVSNIKYAVENGTGIAGCHGGMCDAFRNNTEWQFMTGSQWVSHPGGAEVEYMVTPSTDINDPIMGGISEFKVKSEQYYIHIDPCVKVLATTRFPVADGPHAANGTVDVPVVYKKYWGKGRVFYNSLGHSAKLFIDCPQALEIMVRGLLWASK